MSFSDFVIKVETNYVHITMIITFNSRIMKKLLKKKRNHELKQNLPKSKIHYLSNNHIVIIILLSNINTFLIALKF